MRTTLLTALFLALPACAGELSSPIGSTGTDGGTESSAGSGSSGGSTSGSGSTSEGATSSGGSTSGGSTSSSGGVTSGSSTSTSTSGGSTSGGSTSGGAEAEKVYAPCETDSDCPPEANFCLLPGDGDPFSAFCSYPCINSFECANPTTGDTFAVCKDNEDGMGNGLNWCFASCSNGKTCPTGMICFEEFVLNKNFKNKVTWVCAYPP